MTHENLETIHRALGIIEGVGCVLPTDLARSMLVDAVNMIDDALSTIPPDTLEG